MSDKYHSGYVSPNTNIKYEIKLKSGNYRSYRNGEEFYKSPGKTQEDLQLALQALTRRQIKDNEDFKFAAENPPEPEPKNPEIESIGQSGKEQKTLTEEAAARLEEYSELFNIITREARNNNRDPREVFNEFEKNPSDFLRNYAPKFLETYGTQTEDGVGSEQYILKPELANNIYNALKGNTLPSKLESKVEELQDSRRGIFEELKGFPNTQREKSGATLDSMLGMQPYKAVWDAAPPESRGNLSPQSLHQIDSMKGLGDLRRMGENQASLYSNLMPKSPGDLNLNWGDSPSYERAKQLYDQDFKPNYTYSSADPFNQREHQLASAGHATGSSSLEANEGAKQRAMHKEDLENIFNIQTMLEKDHRARGQTLDQVSSLGTSARTALGEPLQTSESVLGRQFDRESTDYQNQFANQQAIAEGGINLETKDIQDSGELYNILSQDLFRERQEAAQLNNDIYKFLMSAQNIDKASAFEKQQFEQLQQNMFAQRQNVEIALEQLALQKRDQKLRDKAFELKKAQSEGDWTDIIKTIAPTAVAAGIGFAAGGPAGAAIAVLPHMAQFADKPGWFGNPKGEK